MHPQIMQSEAGDCPICGMDLIPVESDEDGLSANEIKMTENAMALANIQTSIVGGKAVGKDEELITLSGKISENKDETAIMPAHFDGRIEALYVKSLGQKVTKGQLIAKVYSPHLVAAQQELITASKNKQTQQQLYNAVRNKFKNWNIHGAILDKIEVTGKVIHSFPLYSHVSGVVTEILVNVGAHIMDGMPIFKVSNLKSVWAVFDVYENQISKLKKNQKIKVITGAYPKEEFGATISFIDPILNNQTRTIAIRATLKNRINLLKPGMFITGEIKVKILDDKGVVSVPVSSVLWTGKRSLVYIKTQPNKSIFEMRAVTLGNRVGEHYQIVSGLTIGDEIVTQGAFTVDAAAQLQGKKSMMNKLGTTKRINKALKQDEIQNHTSSNDVTPFDKEMESSIVFQKEFFSMLKPYLQMKNAFIAGNSKQVPIQAKATAEKMKLIDTTSLGKKEKLDVFKSINILESISKKTNLENQRADFVLLNESMIAIIMNVKSPQQTFYIQKCPMANSNKGASWISADKEIKNPYFGEAMLTCGEEVVKALN